MDQEEGRALARSFVAVVHVDAVDTGELRRPPAVARDELRGREIGADAEEHEEDERGEEQAKHTRHALRPGAGGGGHARSLAGGSRPHHSPMRSTPKAPRLFPSPKGRATSPPSPARC